MGIWQREESREVHMELIVEQYFEIENRREEQALNAPFPPMKEKKQIDIEEYVDALVDYFRKNIGKKNFFVYIFKLYDLEPISTRFYKELKAKTNKKLNKKGLTICRGTTGFYSMPWEGNR
jgi:nitrogenase molybdenum-iron protein alpha/beta subunit